MAGSARAGPAASPERSWSAASAERATGSDTPAPPSRSLRAPAGTLVARIASPRRRRASPPQPARERDEGGTSTRSFRWSPARGVAPDAGARRRRPAAAVVVAARRATAAPAAGGLAPARRERRGGLHAPDADARDDAQRRVPGRRRGRVARAPPRRAHAPDPGRRRRPGRQVELRDGDRVGRGRDDRPRPGEPAQPPRLRLQG